MSDEESCTIEEVISDDEFDEGDDEEEQIFLPDSSFMMEETKLDPDKIAWPPRPTLPQMADLYDQMKEFVIDEDKMEKIYPPMDGEARKLVHTIAELFGLKTKSYGRKSNRHVRIYKYDDIPTTLDNFTQQSIAEGNTNSRTKERKIPMYFKEEQESIREEVLGTVRLLFIFIF